MNKNNRKISYKFAGIILLITVAFILYLIILGNTKTPNEVPDNDYRHEIAIKFELIEEKIALLATNISSLDNNPYVSQSELMGVQQELRVRLESILEQQEGLIKTHELLKLSTQLSELQNQFEQLKLIQVTQPTVIPSPITADKSKVSNNTAPPFRILGIELRGGERVLSVLPHRGKQIDTVVLLMVEDQVDNWRLISFDENEAIFKVGTKTRRVIITKK